MGGEPAKSLKIGGHMSFKMLSNKYRNGNQNNYILVRKGIEKARTVADKVPLTAPGKTKELIQVRDNKQ